MNVKKIAIWIFSFIVISISVYYSFNSQYYTLRDETEHFSENFCENDEFIDELEKENNEFSINNRIEEEKKSVFVVSKVENSEENTKIEDTKKVKGSKENSNFEKTANAELIASSVVADLVEPISKIDSEKIVDNVFISKNMDVTNSNLENSDESNVDETDVKNNVSNFKKSESSLNQDLENQCIDKYRIEFSILRDDFNLKIDKLIESAKTEYKNVDSNKRGELVKELSEKYLKIGISLERESSDKFYSLLSIMEEELRQNNYSLEYIKIAENTFIEEKREKKSELISKAMKILQ